MLDCRTVGVDRYWASVRCAGGGGDGANGGQHEERAGGALCRSVAIRWIVLSPELGLEPAALDQVGWREVGGLFGTNGGSGPSTDACLLMQDCLSCIKATP